MTKRILLLFVLVSIGVSVPTWAQISMTPEDTPTVNGQRLMPVGVKRCDTAAATSAVDGDLVFLCVDANGKLWTTATMTGSKTNNNAAPSTDNVPVIPAIACGSTGNAVTTGRIVFPCTDLFSSVFVVIRNADGTIASLSADPTAGSAASATGPQIMADCDDTATVAGVENAAARFRVNCTSRALYVHPISGTLKSGVITSAMTGTTSTVVVAAQASNYLYIQKCHLSNDHASVTTMMNLQDGSGGTVIWKVIAPFGGGNDLDFGESGLKVPTLGNGLYVVNVTTGSSTYASCNGYYSTASY